MLTRRRAGLGALLVLLVAMVAGLVAARDDDTSDRASVESVDRTTSTTRRRGVTTTSEGSTTSASPPSSEATASSDATGGAGGRAPTTRSPGTTAASPAPPPPAPPPPAPSGLAAARIRLTQVASASYPIAMAVHPPTGAIWIAQKGGSVCRLHGGACTGTQTVASVSTGGEQGLLGIAFNPSGDRFFASYTNEAGDTRVDRFATGSAGAPIGGKVEIYAQAQPATNHNGGNILFGPDGWLYLGLGDGGGAGDPFGNGQNPDTDLGKILRMDQDGGSRSHHVSGVRNPWRFSFDRANGDLWVADVGQGSWEEVDHLPAGAQSGRNLGWSCYEGSYPFSGCTPSGTYVGPIFEYSHAEGCSITGGYVYRGSRIPDLAGAYLFADYCDGELRGLTQDGGRTTLERRLGVNPGNVVSFGQDASGELYVLTPSAVFRIDPA